MTYYGGCLEIDTDRIKGDDVIITHLPTNSRTIKLSLVLQIIKECIDIKKEKKTNHDLDCRVSSLLNFTSSLPITIDYEWTKSKDNIIKSLEVYYKKINELRTSSKYKANVTKDFLDNLTLFNGYQDDLAKYKKYQVK